MAIRKCLSNLLWIGIIAGTVSVSAYFDVYAMDDSERACLVKELDSIEELKAGIDYIDDEVIISCDSEDEAREVIKEYNEVKGIRLSLVDYSYGVAVLKVESDVSVEDVVELALSEDDKLTPVHPNYYEEICSASDEYPGKYVNTDNEYYTDPFTKECNHYQFFHEMIGSKYVWEAIDNGDLKAADGTQFDEALANTVVGVIDTGIYPNNDLTDAIIGGKCFVTKYSEDNYSDGNGHGTNVAGIIADSANELNGRGVASGIKVLSLRVLDDNGSGSSANSIRAINYATQARINYLNGIPVGEKHEDVESYNIRVINMSLGGSGYSSGYSKAIEEAINSGIIVCAAAGNYCMKGNFYPAAYDNVVSVASVNSSFNRSRFSNYGDSIDISAPGGENSYDSEYEDESYERVEWIYASGHTGVNSFSGKRGTSQASPIASAVAAMITAKNPELSPYDVLDIMKSTATKTDESGMGAGCVNAAKALGINCEAAEPKAYIMSDTENEGSISQKEAMSNIELELGNGIYLSAQDDNSVIYYTLNGCEPDLYDVGGSTYIYSGKIDDPDTWLYKDYNNEFDKIIIKARTLLFGTLSDTVTYTVMPKSLYVNKIDVFAKQTTGGAFEDDVDELGHPRCRMAIGSKMALAANVFPSSVKNKNVVWHSSDSSVATVSSTGLVTALAASDGEYITITALAADGQGVYGEYKVCVVNKAIAVEIAPPAAGTCMYDADTIELIVEELTNPQEEGTYYDMSVAAGQVKVWPEDVINKVKYVSSNPKVVEVDSEGIVRAVGAGNAVITVTALDGSNISDKQKFHVTSPLYSMEIMDKNNSDTKNILMAGKHLTPYVVFNSGHSLPNNCSLTWSFVKESDSQYCSINRITGAVSARSNDYVKDSRYITIRAYSEAYDVSALYTFLLRPIISNIRVNDQSIKISSSLNLKNIINISPSSGTYNAFTVTSSNPDVAAVEMISSTQTYIKGISEGIAIITVNALDGSGKKCSFLVEVQLEKTLGSSSKISIVYKKGGNIFYPGKTLNFDIDTAFHAPSSSKKWLFNTESEHLEVSSTGLVKEKHGATPLTEYHEEVLTAKALALTTYLSTDVLIKEYPSKVKEIVLDSISSNESAITLGAGEIMINRVGAYGYLMPRSIPDNSYQSEYWYSSSNNNVVSVSEHGKITACNNGSAIITIEAGDGSGTKKKIRVVVSQDKVSSISLPVNTIQLSTVLAGGLDNYIEIPRSLITVSPSTARSDLQVSSLNKKVADVVLKDKVNINDPDIYIIKAVGKGQTTIKFSSIDGSKKYAALKVTVSEPVTSIVIKSSSNSFVTKPGKTIRLTALTNNATNKKVVWEIVNEGDEKYASLNAATGTFTAAKDDVIGDIERVVKVRAVALDYGGYVSLPMNVVISTSKVKMKNIRVKSKDDVYDFAAGTKINMLATTTLDATDKRVAWSVNDEAASISSSGVLSINKGLTEKKTITITAAAKDGSGVSGSCNVNIYPMATSILISGNKEMNAGDLAIYNIEALPRTSDSFDKNELCQKFKITYTNACGKVYLNNSDGTSITVNAIKKGRIAITAKALDGSNKQKVFYVDVK